MKKTENKQNSTRNAQSNTTKNVKNSKSCGGKCNSKSSKDCG